MTVLVANGNGALDSVHGDLVGDVRTGLASSDDQDALALVLQGVLGKGYDLYKIGVLLMCGQ